MTHFEYIYREIRVYKQHLQEVIEYGVKDGRDLRDRLNELLEKEKLIWRQRSRIQVDDEEIKLKTYWKMETDRMLRRRILCRL